MAAEPVQLLQEAYAAFSSGDIPATARESGRPLDVPFVHVWTVRDGTLCRFQDYTDTAKVLHALGAIAPA